MPARTDRPLLKTVLALLVCLTVAGDAMAYTLPSPEFFGQFLALAGWAFVAFASMLLYPVYALLRYFRGPRPKPPAAPPETPAPDAPDPTTNEGR